MIPFEFRRELWCQKTIVWHYLHDPMFNRFDTIPECDRQTDRHTSTAYNALSIASRGKKWREIACSYHVFSNFCGIYLHICRFYCAALCKARYMPSSCVCLCVCVCVCVCVSVTLRCCIKMANHRITQIMPHDNPDTLVFSWG